MVSVVRFPTEKAYGITISHTIAALEAKGNIVELFTPETVKSTFLSKKTWINQMPQITSRILGLLQKMALKGPRLFLAYRVGFAFLLRTLIGNDTRVIWTRDPIIFIFLRNQNTSTLVLEIHQEPNWIDHYAIKRLSKKSRIILAPISKALKTTLEFNYKKLQNVTLIELPMGVPETFLEFNGKKKPNTATDLRVGYLGGFYSNGVDQQISQTIECFKKISDATKITHFRIIGVEAEEMEKLDENAQNDRFIEAYPRVDQQTVLKLLEPVDIFILPYPEGKFFSNRYPLKALEYAALRKPILASRTVSHSNIFADDEVWFYEYGNCLDLQRAIKEMFDDICELQNRVTKSFDLALQHSYARRVERVLAHLK